MGITKELEMQLKTEYKEDAEKCLEICKMLKANNDGHIWASQFNPLVGFSCTGVYPNNKRRYFLTKLGELVYAGIKANENKA